MLFELSEELGRCSGGVLGWSARHRRLRFSADESTVLEMTIGEQELRNALQIMLLAHHGPVDPQVASYVTAIRLLTERVQRDHREHDDAFAFLRRRVEDRRRPAPRALDADRPSDIGDIRGVGGSGAERSPVRRPGRGGSGRPGRPPAASRRW